MSAKIIQFQGSYRHVHPDTMDCGMFRALDEAEHQALVTWAKGQPEGVVVNPLWHPVVQDELLTSGRGVLPGKES